MTFLYRESPQSLRFLRPAVAATLLLAILGLGGWLRFVCGAETVVDTPIRADAIDYVSYAENLRTSGTYSATPAWAYQPGSEPIVLPDAKRPPAYALQLRLSLDGRPDDAFVRRVSHLQAWLSMLTIVVSFVVAWRLLGLWPALAVALLVAISPHLVIFVAYLLSETLFALMLCLAALAGTGWAIRRGQRRARLWALATGAALGLCSLVRPTLDQLPWVLLVLTLLLPILRPHRAAAGLVLCGFLLVMSPWYVRNQLTLGSLGDSRLLTSTLHHGSYPGFMYNDDPTTRGYPYRADPRTPEIGASVGSAIEEIARKFRSDPIPHAVWYIYGKPVQFLAWEIVEGWGDIYTYPILYSPYFSDVTFRVTRSLMLGMHAPLGIAGVLGMILLLSPWAQRYWSEPSLCGLRVCAVIFLYAIALHVIGAPYPRYSVPFRPLQYILAVAFVMAAAKEIIELRKRNSI